MSDINQDDIDKLLQGGLDGEGGNDAEPAAAAPAPAPEDTGPASQDDIDALFAAAGGDEPEPAPAESTPEAAPAEPTPEPEAAPEPPAAEPELDLEGVAGQDDIDALFAAVGGAGGDTPAPPEPAPEPEAAAESPAAEPELDLEGVAGQDDIDALFAAVGGPADAAPAAEEPAEAAAPTDEAAPEEAAAPSEPASSDQAEGEETAAVTDTQLNALLTSIAQESGDGSESDPSDTVHESEAGDGTDDAIDLDELLREVSAAAPPPPPAPPPKEIDDEMAADTAVLSADQSAALAAGADVQAAPTPEPPPAPAPVQATPPPQATMAADAGPRKEFSVLYGAGEVESVAGQIGALISSLTEKAHGYMQAWIAADSEAKELRMRALSEERRRTSVENEKSALATQLDELRARLAEAEGGKVAGEEARRTLETSYQAKIRELESQVTLLTSEAESLKDELTRARNQATGVDIESRRARFEVDRLKNEVESERMERLRIQRALENREKELQAAQSQSSGQASSLFIDELHRLVRRLESELDARASGAHDALRQLDRIDVGEDMVPVVANIRAALMQALGNDDADDALKTLGREASGVKGPAAVAPGKVELVSFETALSTYNLVEAVDVAGTLLREARATPAVLMRKIYQCPALRRPEVGDRLADVARLLEGLRTVQEAGDRSRGQETGESEVFYVHMFDYLHNLVKLKLINRMSGDIWRLFLDLRGRFSFVTSDRQWAEYRDNTLNSRADKA